MSSPIGIDLARLAIYLPPNFQDFLYANADFSTTEINLKDKRRLLRSLSRQTEFIGPCHMSYTVAEVFVTLEIVLQTAPAELLPAYFSTWCSFIRTLETAFMEKRVVTGLKRAFAA